MVFILILLTSQRSSLWSSLIIIPLRLTIIISSRRVNIFSSLFIFIFIMVFIGGLLVLLLRVVSISYQEQGYSFLKNWVLITVAILIPLILEFKGLTYSNALIFRVSWLEFQRLFYIVFISILIISLLTMRKLILRFKGLIRSL